jgi:uncharacterized protein
MNAAGALEQPIWIDCNGDRMLGIHTRAAFRRGVGVLIVTGGPQYRAGSHRQFTLLARRLAADGYDSLRFDVRGMGDSTGEPRSFTELDDDIDAALRHAGGTSRVVILGLCDAASAALLYLARRRSAAATAVDGLVLINPWVRSAGSLAQAQLKHYYGARLAQGDFWRKVVRGQFDVVGSLRSLASNLRTAFGRTTPSKTTSRYQDEMADRPAAFWRPILLVTSGNDLTAREFLDYAAADPNWRGLLQRPTLTHHELVEADHTFSLLAAQKAFEAIIVDWLGHTGRVRDALRNRLIRRYAGQCSRERSPRNSSGKCISVSAGSVPPWYQLSQKPWIPISG